MSKAFVICCKESDYIIQCVESINKYYSESDIFIVDSCSSDKSYIERLLPIKNVNILDVCNKNYEYGAYMHWYKQYGNNYDKYIFMQDSIMINDTIPEFENLSDNNVLVFSKNFTGWYSGPYHRDYWYNLNPQFPYNNCDSILMTIWNTFAINSTTFNKVVNSDIFKSSSIPDNKILSCAWERVWSIIFYENNITINNIDETKVHKIFGNRQ